MNWWTEEPTTSKLGKHLFCISDPPYSNVIVMRVQATPISITHMISWHQLLAYYIILHHIRSSTQKHRQYSHTRPHPDHIMTRVPTCTLKDDTKIRRYYDICSPMVQFYSTWLTNDSNKRQLAIWTLKILINIRNLSWRQTKPPHYGFLHLCTGAYSGALAW